MKKNEQYSTTPLLQYSIQFAQPIETNVWLHADELSVKLILHTSDK
jgi:hypothetical protein